MSYSIYYDRAFVRVGDKFIPLVNSGSNNCFELKGNREVPEKDWGILNWNHRDQAIFTESEIHGIAKHYDQYNQESGMIHKSRHRLFDPGEFERWIINGIKNAYTVEEYRSFGNSFYVLDYSPSEIEKWVRHPFSTTAELLDTLARFDGKREISIKLSNNREVYRPKNHRPRGRGLKPGDLPEYYVLGGVGTDRNLKGQMVYLVKLRPSGISYLKNKDSHYLKIFRTEREAERYYKKYESRLKRFAMFRPELVTSSQAGSATA